MSKVFERHNQAMYDTVRSNMTFINLPLYLLKLCVSDQNFYTEKSTIKSVEMTPYQIWYGMLKPYCIFYKFGYMRHMFDILKTPNQISALLRLFQKVWYSSITTPKQYGLLLRTVCFEENSFLQKSEWEDSATC